MTKFQVMLAVAGLVSHAAAFVPVPASWWRPSAVAAASSTSADRHSKTNRASLAMKKEPAAGARGGKAGAKGAADEAIDPRRQALDGVLHQIERCYGRGSILKMGDTTSMDVETSSTGSMTLDIALGGGYPRGRVVEIYGPESSGKTTLALHALAEIQKTGGVAAFIDAEHALDPAYADRLGVDVADLLVSQPDSGEMALDVVDQLVRSNAVDMVVVDSVAALVPRAELEGEMADMQMGLQARLMSKAMRKVTGSLSKSQCTVVFLNQLRSKIGVIYGSPEVTSGGNALKYYSSVRLDVRRKESLRDNAGITVKVKVAKNKIAPPFRVVEMDILFGTGIDTVSCLLDAAEDAGFFTRKGSWYSYEGKNVSQGRLNTVAHLKENQALRETLQGQVRTHLLEKAIKDREGGVADTPITDLEDDEFASSADGGAAAAAPAAKPRRRTAGSVEETLGV
ncbi:unnamed protein product [Ectocarpus sp. 6 AP-2014]